MFFILGEKVIIFLVIDFDLGENGCVSYVIIVGNLEGYFGLSVDIGDLML